MPSDNSVRVVAVASGKGGVGKTNVSVNLAYALAKLGQSTLLLDADLGMANVDLLLDLQPERDLADVVAGRCALDEIMVRADSNLYVVPAGSGLANMATLGQAELNSMMLAFSALPLSLDALIVDTAAGIAESVCHFCCAAQEVVVVVCNEPASLTDAYALMKVLGQRGCSRFQLLVNRAASTAEASQIHRRLSEAARRFLDVHVALLGAVPEDPFVRRAVQRREAVVHAFPGSVSAAAFRQLAQRVIAWPHRDAEGRSTFFADRPVTYEKSKGVASLTI